MVGVKNMTASALRFAAPRLAILAAASLALAAIPAAADVTATTTLTNRIVCSASPNSTVENAVRVFVSGNFVFALEQGNARIAVYDLVGRTNLFYFGATAQNGQGIRYTDSTLWKISNANGGFKRPYGMALDTFSGENRFAVADSGNGRVQLFSFDPGTGDIAFEAASDKLFKDDSPKAVAFTESGDILVADIDNCRVVRLNSSLAQTASYSLDHNARPIGICADSDTSEGFWISDSKNQRIAYYRIADGTSAPVVFFGTVASKDFVEPSDIQILGDSPNGGKYICAVDKQGARVRVVEAVVSGGAYVDIVPVGDVGHAADGSLQYFEQLYQPNGIFVDGNTLYVTDYGKDYGSGQNGNANLVKWFEVEASSSPTPPAPTEEYETVRWGFTSIDMSGGAASLAWAFPSTNVPSSGECLFTIDYRTSLTTGSWATLVEDISSTSAAGCAYQADLSALGAPPSCFFRLYWTNKVKE